MKAKPLFILSIVILLAAAGMFFSQNRSLNNKLGTSQQALNEAEKALIYYKNTDLAKEVELLQLKLVAAQKDLVASQNDATTAKARVKTLEAGNAKLLAYLAAIDAIETMIANGPTPAGVATVDAKILVLNDSQVSAKWAQAKAGIDLERRSWSGESISDTVKTITLRIRDLGK